MADEEQQQLIMEYQMLNNQLKQMGQEMQMLEQQARELEQLLECVEEVGKAAKGTEVLSAVGGGVYIRTKLDNNNEFLVNSGAKIIATKTKEEAKALLAEQLAELKKISDNMQMQFQQGFQRFVALQQELQHMQKKK